MSRIAITDAESLVMQALWEAGEATAEDLIAAVAAPNDWAEATVRTLINRLLTKGAITAEKEGRRYLYSPVLKREAWVLEESSGLLDRLRRAAAQRVREDPVGGALFRAHDELHPGGASNGSEHLAYAVGQA